MSENENSNINNSIIPKGMKVCKTCGKPIAKNAKVCPNCGAKQKGKLGLIIGIVVILLIIGAIASGGGNGGSGTSSSASKEDSKKEEVTEQAIEYTEYSMTEIMNDLENNAAAANEKYKGQYVILTGELSVIDAQGSYISIKDPDADFSLSDCKCNIKGNAEVADIVKTLSKGDIISVKGKITDVGELMGYTMDIEEIITD